MAVAVPVLAGIGGGAAAAALGAGTALSIGTGLATGAATASLMRRSGGGAPAPAAPVAETPAPAAPATPAPPAPPAPPPNLDVSEGGAIRNVEAIQGERQGDTRVPGTGAGRQSTILTSGRGIMSDEGTRPGRGLTAAGGLLRPQRGMSAGLIA